LQVVAQDFTIEAWVRYNGDPGTDPRTVASKWDTASGRREWILQTQDQTVQFWISTTGGDATNYGGGGFNPIASQWYHIAACRHGNLLRTFVDGTQVGVVTFTGTIHADTAPFCVGASLGSFPNYHNGWLDDVRYTVGVARYTGNFSVPTGPHSGGGGADTIVLGTSLVDLDIDGLTINLLADTDIAGALTAVTYGGIPEADLVDKDATESITGQWTFSALVTIGSGVTLALPAAGQITGDDVVFNLSGTARAVRLIDVGNTTEFMMGTAADPDALLGIIPSSFTFMGGKVWHAGNDGDGSGLDADKVGNIPNTNLMTFTGAQRPILNDLDEMNVGAAATGHVIYWDGAQWDVAFTDTLAATLVTQAAAEAGTETLTRWWSALRVKQAIVSLGLTAGAAEVITGFWTFPVAGIKLTDANTYIKEGASNVVRLGSNSGYIDIGPGNTSWCHLKTDRAAYHIDKPFNFGAQPKFYLKGAMPYYDSTSHASAKITVSTSPASGGANGDIHFKV